MKYQLMIASGERGVEFTSLTEKIPRFISA